MTLKEISGMHYKAVKAIGILIESCDNEIEDLKTELNRRGAACLVMAAEDSVFGLDNEGVKRLGELTVEHGRMVDSILEVEARRGRLIDAQEEFATASGEVWADFKTLHETIKTLDEDRAKIDAE